MNSNTKTSREVLALVKKHGPISSPALSKMTGKTVATIDFYMRILHRSEPKQVYVAKKHDTVGRGRNARLWAAGDRPDELQLAPVPALTDAEVAAESEDEYVATDKRRQAAIAANRVYRHWQDEALFGEARA